MLRIIEHGVARAKDPRLDGAEGDGGPVAERATAVEDLERARQAAVRQSAVLVEIIGCKNAQILELLKKLDALHREHVSMMQKANSRFEDVLALLRRLEARMSYSQIRKR